MAWARESVNASIIVLGSRGGYDATPEGVCLGSYKSSFL